MFSFRSVTARQQRPLADSIDSAGPQDVYCHDNGDYRSALNLSELRRLQQPYTSCVTCNTSGARDTGKQQTVVCTVRNTRTATLVHRLQQNNGGSGGLPCTPRYLANGRQGGGSGMYQCPGDVCDDLVGMVDKDSTQSDIFCHSPYCIYSKTLPSTAIYNTTSATTSNVDENTAPDVASLAKLQRQSSNCSNDAIDNRNWLPAGQLSLGDCFSAASSPNPQQHVDASHQGQSQLLMENDLTRSCLVPALADCPLKTEMNEVHQGAAYLLSDS